MRANLVIGLLGVLQVIYVVDAAGQQGRNKRCIKPPELEGCSVILLKWSYKEATNKCEENFVCSKHPNSFQNKAECTQYCPPIPGKKPKPEKVDCMTWLLRGDRCYQFAFRWYPNNHGVLRWGMLYTGCGKWSTSLYFYDWEKRNAAK
uniref:Putative kunitz-type serine protease inhibitor pivl n=1 Tax=Amblyomma tuberculatum TaxID=48802 RepID=A0A6M2E3M6_9ACAR